MVTKSRRYGKYRYLAFLTFLYNEARKEQITGITDAMTAFNVHRSTSAILQEEATLTKSGRLYKYNSKRKPTLEDAETLMHNVSAYSNSFVW